MVQNNTKKVLVGFDGSVDSTVKPIRIAGTPNEFFSTIDEYGSYIASKAGLSCSIQIEQKEIYAGGCAPFVATALANMGFDVTLVGMLGSDQILPEFEVLDEHGIKLRSFDDPSFNLCFEFDDGKIMLARQVGELNGPFDKVVASLEDRIDLLWKSDLVAMLNWGEITWMQELWMGAVECIETNSTPDMSKIIFIDLADISCRPKEDINRLLIFLKRATAIRHTILGMNENEMLTLGRLAFGGCVGEELLRKLNQEKFAAEVVLQTLKMTTAYDGSRFYHRATEYVEKPLISTGAGDNFNAGYCAAAILELPMGKKIKLANLSSHTYLTTGKPISRRIISNEICHVNLPF